MKKILVFMIFLLSCSQENFQEEYSVIDIKYITRNSEVVGELINRSMVDKELIILSYPEYVEESYQLMKFIIMIMKKYGIDSINFYGLPEFTYDELNENLLKIAPLKAHTSFIDLFNFLKGENIEFSKLKRDGNKSLVIVTQENFIKAKDEGIKLFGREEMLTLVMAGNKETRELQGIINTLPTGKNVSAIPLDNWRFDELRERYDYLILMGSIMNYKKTESVDLYNEENYLDAPEDFRELNKSLIRPWQINKMNNYLDKQIEDGTIHLEIVDKRG